MIIIRKNWQKLKLNKNSKSPIPPSPKGLLLHILMVAITLFPDASLVLNRCDTISISAMFLSCLHQCQFCQKIDQKARLNRREPISSGRMSMSDILGLSIILKKKFLARQSNRYFRGTVIQYNYTWALTLLTCQLYIKGKMDHNKNLPSHWYQYIHEPNAQRDYKIFKCLYTSFNSQVGYILNLSIKEVPFLRNSSIYSCK